MRILPHRKDLGDMETGVVPGTMLTGRRGFFLWEVKLTLKLNAFPSDSWSRSSKSRLGYFLFQTSLYLAFFFFVEQIHSLGNMTHTMNSSRLE